MNERIKLLKQQAGIDFNPDQEGLDLFAELIVKECADWINDNVGLIDEEARADLLKHFGVEE
jgi:hypothetical protein